MIISFLNQKGGVGKTTLAVNVAACLALTGHRVLLVDADKQGSATTWASLREDSDFQVISLARENMARDATQMATDYDHTIIRSSMVRPMPNGSRGPALPPPILCSCLSSRPASRHGPVT
jgi:cellulose biosynthesis protein BcsQ